MSKLIRIRFLDEDGLPDLEEMVEIERDVQAAIGTGEWVHLPADPGAKSVALVPDLTTLAVAIVSSRAAVSLVDVLKTHLLRKSGKLVLKFPDGREMRLESGDIGRLADAMREGLGW